jgi:hypothetical protein
MIRACPVVRKAYPLRQEFFFLGPMAKHNSDAAMVRTNYRPGVVDRR